MKSRTKQAIVSSLKTKARETHRQIQRGRPTKQPAPPVRTAHLDAYFGHRLPAAPKRDEEGDQ